MFRPFTHPNEPDGDLPLCSRCGLPLSPGAESYQEAGSHDACAQAGIWVDPDDPTKPDDDDGHDPAGPRPVIYLTGPAPYPDASSPRWSAHAITALGSDDGATFTVVASWPTEPDAMAVRARLVEAVTRLAGWDDAEVRSTDHKTMTNLPPAAQRSLTQPRRTP
jgi:hypothetical protein